MAKVVILGAGLTGLSTAYHLEKNKFFDFKIFERNKTPGGLCRSVKHDGFTFDYTGHLIHCNNNYFQSFLQDIFPPNSLNKITRNSYVYSHKTFTPYPFQMNLHGLPTNVIIECLCGFAKRKHYIKTPKTFHEWVLKYFGAGIGKHFHFPYNTKLLSYNLKKVSPSWIGRFIPQATIKDIFQGTFENPKTQNIGYNHIFYYPQKKGTQFFVDNIVNKIKTPIQTQYEVDKINIKQKTLYFTNGEKEKFDTLITTIPLNNLLKKLKEPSDINLKQTSNKIFCNSVINFNLGFNVSPLTNKHWIYIPEKQYPFYRIGFWHNFSNNIVKQNCSALYGELAYLPKAQKISYLKKLLDQSVTKTLKILGLNKSNIVTKKILHLKHAFVIYNEWREKNLKFLHQALNKQAIHSIGRYGEWKYSGMQEAIIDGKNIVDLLLFSRAQKIKTSNLFSPAKLIKQEGDIKPKTIIKEKQNSQSKPIQP